MADLREMAREQEYEQPIVTLVNQITNALVVGTGVQLSPEMRRFIRDKSRECAASFAEKVLRQALDLGESWDTMQDLKEAIRREFGL